MMIGRLPLWMKESFVAQVWIYVAADGSSPMKLTRAADVRHIEQDREMLRLELEGNVRIGGVLGRRGTGRAAGELRSRLDAGSDTR